jgi:dTDP-4-dehydrorhamnose 3,5-epimerase-like enzyme
VKKLDEDLPSEPLVPLEAPFVDARGAIKPLLEREMRSALLISSRAGTVRANHYHKTDWHYCYVVSGRIEYYHRPAGSTAAPEKVVVGAGEMFFSPAMVEHAMVFPVDTVFLTLSRNARDQEAYEDDLVRTTLIQ